MVDIDELHLLSGKLIINPDNPMYSLRNNVLMYISHKDITINEVAELADIPVSTLKSLLYGNSKDCSLSMAIKLAKVFDISIDELVGANTIEPLACKSIQTLRLLPKSFTNFIRWIIQFRYKNENFQNIRDTTVEIMDPNICPEGNLKMSNRFEAVTFNSLSTELASKIFIGIRIPSNLFEPFYFEGSILLLADDRRPRNGEHVIFSSGYNLWLSEYRDGVLYSIRNGTKYGNLHDTQNVVGYIAKVIES